MAGLLIDISVGGIAGWQGSGSRHALPLNGAPMTQVEAEGDTDSRPRPGFTPRKGKGLPFLGKSSSTPPKAKVRSEIIFHRALVAPVK